MKLSIYEKFDNNLYHKTKTYYNVSYIKTIDINHLLIKIGNCVVTNDVIEIDLTEAYIEIEDNQLV